MRRFDIMILTLILITGVGIFTLGIEVKELSSEILYMILGFLICIGITRLIGGAEIES